MCEFVRIASHCDFFFFFQAEDGIRFLTVTGVQTCALPIFAVPVFDRRDVDQVVIALLRRVAQPGHRVEQGFARDVHDRVAAGLEPAADRAAEGRSQGVDGRVHAERNWWTELPNGSEITSICSGGSRRPRSSSSCSSRRGTRSNSDSPLIFLCSSNTPYNSPSGRGGHPGT